MMDLPIHSQYISTIGWVQALVSHISISLGGPRVPMYDTTFWTHFDPQKNEASMYCQNTKNTALVDVMPTPQNRINVNLLHVCIMTIVTLLL